MLGIRHLAIGITLFTLLPQTVWAKRQKKFSFRLGASPTVLFYRETVNEIQTRDVKLTGNASLGFSTGILELSVGGFMSLVNLMHSGSDVLEAKFNGLNVRGGIRTGYLFRVVRFHIATGWYRWAMTVSDLSYGLELVSGYQAFLSMDFKKKSKKDGRVSVYFKFAPVARSAADFILSNREIAIGSRYQLSSSRAKVKTYVTADYSNFKYQVPGSSRQVSLNTVSLGLQLGL